MARRTSHLSEGTLNCLGPKIRDFREERNWTQAALALQLQIVGWDIDLATLNRIEKQARTLTDFELLLFARVLKKRLRDFEPATGDKPRPG